MRTVSYSEIESLIDSKMDYQLGENETVKDIVLKLTTKFGPGNFLKIKDIPENTYMFNNGQHFYPYGFVIGETDQLLETISWVAILDNFETEEELLGKIDLYKKRHMLQDLAVPRAIYLTQGVKSYQEIKRKEEIVKKLYRNAVLWNASQKLYAEYMDEISKETLKDLEKKYDVIEISPNEDIFSESFTNSINTRMKDLKDYFEKLEPRIQKNSLIFMNFNRVNRPPVDFLAFLAEFHDRTKTPVYIANETLRKAFLSELTGLYNHSTLFEDRFRKILARYLGFGIYINSDFTKIRHVRIRSLSPRVKIEVFKLSELMGYDELSDIKPQLLKKIYRGKIEFEGLKRKPQTDCIPDMIMLREYFNLNTSSYDEFYDKSEVLYDLMRKWELLMNYTKPLTLRDAILVRYNGETYFGRATFEPRAEVDELEKHRIAHRVVYEEKKLGRIYGINIIADYKEHIREMFQFVNSCYKEGVDTKEFNTSLGTDLQDVDVYLYYRSGRNKLAVSEFTGTNLFNKELGDPVNVICYQRLMNFVIGKLDLSGLRTGKYIDSIFTISGGLNRRGSYSKVAVTQKHFGDISYKVRRYLEDEE